MELRDYQTDLIDKVRDSFRSGHKRVIIQASTGAGKTCIVAAIADLALQKGSKVLFICHRRELCYQARDRFADYGLDSGLILAGEEPDLSQDIQICTYQTYSRRIKMPEWFVDADLCIVDECTYTICPVMTRLLENYADKPVIGLSATPCRGDFRGLGEFYDDIVTSISFGQLVEQGYLVPYRYFAPAEIDLEKIKTAMGDYEKKELGHRMDKPKLIGDIYEQWAKIAGGSQTIIFAVNVKHSIHIRDKFQAHGINCEHLDAHTPQDERSRILGDLDNGNVQVVTNVGILCEGFDCPTVECIVLARPTKSYALYIQMSGRASRIHNGKTVATLLDHGGCIEKHGLLDEEVEWSLDGKEKAWHKPKKKEETAPKMVKCTFCNMVFCGLKECPTCGSPIKIFGRKVETIDGDLEEINPKKATMADKRRFYGMAKQYVFDRGWKPGSADMRYKDRFEVWPNSIKDTMPIDPDRGFINYMQSCNERYAKERK